VWEHGVQEEGRQQYAVQVCAGEAKQGFDHDESWEPRRPRQDLSSRVPERRKDYDLGCWTPHRILYLALGLKEELGAIELIGCH
jgi:hypothetical protein